MNLLTLRKQVKSFWFARPSLLDLELITNMT